MESLNKTISTSSGLGRLQMVSELDTGRCADENVEPPNGVNCEIPHWFGEGNKGFLIRVWKPLPSRCVLKP